MKARRSNKTLIKRRTRERTFCQEYVKDLNGTRSAIAAGYSKRTAYSKANQLLKKVEVKALLAKLTKKRAEKLEISADKVLAELARMGFANVMDYVRTTKKGDVYFDFSTLTREQAAAIQSIKIDEYTDGRGENAREIKQVRLKMSDKTRSLELLGKYLKLFTDKIEVTGLEQLPELLAAARARAGKA